MPQISALSVVVVGLEIIIFAFLWRMAASKLAESDNPNIVALSAAMSVVL